MRKAPGFLLDLAGQRRNQVHKPEGCCLNQTDTT
jgi:hypothetical protein